MSDKLMTITVKFKRDYLEATLVRRGITTRTQHRSVNSVKNTIQKIEGYAAQRGESVIVVWDEKESLTE